MALTGWHARHLVTAGVQIHTRLPRLRDEELYGAVTSAGWWELPPCTGDYAAEQWWDVVNYLRSLDRLESLGQPLLVGAGLFTWWRTMQKARAPGLPR